MPIKVYSFYNLIEFINTHFLIQGQQNYEN